MSLTFMNTTNATTNLTVNTKLSLAIVVLEVIFLIIALYVMVSLPYVVWKTTRSSHGHAVEKKKNILFGLLFFYTLITAVKYAFALWVYYVPLSPATIHHCVQVTTVYQSVHVVGLMALYSFLWFRQYTLYQEPHLSHLATPCINRFSRILLVIIFVVGISAFIGVTQSNYEDSFNIIKGTNACFYVHKLISFNLLIIYFGSCLIVAMQGCILFLFIHILRLYQNFQLQDQPSGRATTSDRIRLLIRNCTIAAALSTLSDVAVVALNIVLRDNNTQLIINGLWDIDCFINLACTIFCFSNWKEILWPWCDTKKTERNITSSSAVQKTATTIN